MFGHTARMAFVVWSTPHPGMTDDFERWYNEVHLPDAIENGSFVAMHRYEAVGPGFRAAPYLSIAEADYGDEAEAWAAVRQRAQSLHDAGRIDDLYRVDFATMLLTVDAEVSDHPVATLTTVQNDWRHPQGDARTWLESVPVPPARRARCNSSPPTRGVSGGRVATSPCSRAPPTSTPRWQHGPVRVPPARHRFRRIRRSSASRARLRRPTSRRRTPG